MTSAPRFATVARGMQATDSQFDIPLVELRRKIEELEGFPAGSSQEKEIERLRSQLKKSTAAAR